MNKIINCSGMMSKLGVSTSSPKVIESVSTALQNFYVMDELKKAVGLSIAKKLSYENAIVVNSASAGIVLALASTKVKTTFNENEFFSTKSNVVCPTGHLINFNANISIGIRLANQNIVRAGTKRKTTIGDLKKAITDETTAIFIVKSHYTANVSIPSLLQIKKLADKYNITLVLDAAAEENFKQYQKHCHLVIGSGAKYFQGPTSGFVAGNNKVIKQIFQIEDSLGRYFKVGKEALLGLQTAIYEKKKSKIEVSILDIKNEFVKNKKLKCSIVNDKTRKSIKRIKVKVIKGNTSDFIKHLSTGKIRIFTRNYEWERNIIHFDFRLVKKEEVKNIIEKVMKW